MALTTISELELQLTASEKQRKKLKKMLASVSLRMGRVVCVVAARGVSYALACGCDENNRPRSPPLSFHFFSFFCFV